MKRIKHCRYVPGFNGSPAWMSIERARELQYKDTAYVNRMVDMMRLMGDDKSADQWLQMYPRIEHVE